MGFRNKIQESAIPTMPLNPVAPVRVSSKPMGVSPVLDTSSAMSPRQPEVQPEQTNSELLPQPAASSCKKRKSSSKKRKKSKTKKFTPREGSVTNNFFNNCALTNNVGTMNFQDATVEDSESDEAPKASRMSLTKGHQVKNTSNPGMPFN